MVFMGTAVVYGRAGLVTATGMRTELGRSPIWCKVRKEATRWSGGWPSSGNGSITAIAICGMIITALAAA